MQPNAFTNWLTQRAQVAPAPKRDELQLAASGQQQTLSPIIHQSLREANAYLPQPQQPAYSPPQVHERIATHQAPHKQLSGGSNINSLYLLPPPKF